MLDMTPALRETHRQKIERDYRLGKRERPKPAPMAAVEPEPEPEPERAPFEVEIDVYVDTGDGGPYPSMPQILRAVSIHYGVSVVEIKSDRRTRIVARPRQMSYYLCRTLARASLTTIGRFIGWRDHTSVLHGSRKIVALAAVDPRIRDDIDVLVSKLKKRPPTVHIGPCCFDPREI